MDAFAGLGFERQHRSIDLNLAISKASTTIRMSIAITGFADFVDYFAARLRQRDRFIYSMVR
jgi:hypothetical protein